MKITPPDPLSREERELATMLARLAPHGVPSPEIDARILSASHDAVVANRRAPARRRWPLAMGLAASMVLAVGVAWQLRPTQPGASGIQQAPSAAWSSADAPGEPAAPEARVQPALASAVAEPVPEPLPAEAADPAPAPPPAQFVVPPEASPRVTGVTRPRQAAAAPPAKHLAPPPPPVAPPAALPPVLPSASVHSKSADLADAQRREAVRDGAETASANEAGLTAEARSAERRELRVAPTSERVQESASTADGGPGRTRRTELQVPVAADAQLQVDDWLERVRTRYGLGDEEAARRSLMLFVQDHPTEPVPGDLEPLLDE